MIGALLLAALVVWALGALADLVAGPRDRYGRGAPYVAAMCGSGLVAAAGVVCVLHPQGAFSLGSTLALGETSLRLDALAGLFLTLSGGLGMCVSACLLSWAGPQGRITGRGTGAGYLLLLGSVTVVFVAGDAFTFLFAWESLTVAFYVLTGARRIDGAAARASWVTLGMGKASGAALLLGFLLLAGRSGSLTLSSFAHVPTGDLHDAAYALIVAGFGAKVGLVPFQVWLPVGYPAAQGPARAAMAGVAVNAGFYGLWRFLGILGRPPIWLVVVVLVLGGITALVGIAFAAVQSSLNRVIAYSSVENAGLITVGYGVALAGAATGNRDLLAVGLLAATLQVLAHGVAKCGLFASAAFVSSDEGTDDLESLRGVGRRHPVSGAAFGLGSLTLAGMPPTIGFVSEWFLLEALLQEFRVNGLALRLAMATAGALVALTAGVAALTFVRLLGLCILGRPEKPPATTTVLDGGVAGRGGLALLAAACLGLSAACPWVIRYLALGLAPVVTHSATLSALKSPWVLQPVFSTFSILSPSWLSVVMPVAFMAVALMAVMLSRGRLLQVRRVPAWRSATGGVAGPDRYSAFGYANSIRHVLGNVLGSEHSSQAIEPGGSAKDPASPGEEPHVEVRSALIEPVEEYLYRPARALFLQLVGVAKRLQSGRLDAYIAYMLVALLAVLAAVAALR
ncbi:MAG: proton-conducting transporter membrane subunit [Acidimicrobiales bacterium]|jgi:formate hydrogenlyase subunit 3/multisubunit Na+/H+ antiporter MnhD subunit